MTKVIASIRRCRTHTSIGQIASVTAIRSSRVNFNQMPNTSTLDHSLHHALSSRRAADISQTYEKNAFYLLIFHRFTVLIIQRFTVWFTIRGQHLQSITKTKIQIYPDTASGWNIFWISSGMKNHDTQPLWLCGHRAILFLRIFISGVMLIHVVGKMQTYDNLVLTFPQFLGMNPPTTLSLSIALESLMAAMLLLGTGTRIAAAAMVVVTVITLIQAIAYDGASSYETKMQLLYCGIYLTLLIAGGGRYAYEGTDEITKNSPK